MQNRKGEKIWMHHAARREDAHLSLMTADSCQGFYNDMYGQYNIDSIDLMKNITTHNLAASAKAFDDAMEEYRKNYDKLNVKIISYKDLGEFEREYLG